MLTPLDFQGKEFLKAFRGYDTEEVDKFFALVARDFERLYQDNIEIKAAIEKMYGVAVESVNTMNYGGGTAKMKYTTKGVAYERKKVYKKAVITVASGDYIDFYSSI